MKNLFKLLILLLFLIGCVVKKPVYIDPAFKEHAEFFESYYETTITVSITFKNLEYPVVGVCMGGKRVYIDPEFWEKIDFYRREALIFHELGHCIFKRDHDNAELILNISPTDCPITIMNEYLITTYCYQRYHDYYLEELGE